MKFFLMYATVAYGFVFLGTLVRFVHFICKFRLASPTEFGRALIFFWSPPLLLSLLTFPFEVCLLFIHRGFIEIDYAYDAACNIFNVGIDDLYFQGRVRFLERGYGDEPYEPF